ncbi:YjcZ family sporulation protein [Bacillus sp. HC-Mk]
MLFILLIIVGASCFC